MISQRIGRLPMRIIGFGIRCVSSPMRTPSPPQKMTTFIGAAPVQAAEPGSKIVAVGIGTTSLAPHSAVYASCSLISRARFHGRITMTSGRVSAMLLRRVDRDVRPRRVLALLVRVPVDGVVEEVRPDAAVVEQRVPLPRRAVADDLLALAPEVDEQLEERALRLAHAFGEASVRLRVAHPLRVLAGEQLGDGGAGATPAPACCRKTRSEPPWLGSSSTSTRSSPCAAEDRADRVEREVREVLVVDRVVLEVLDAASRGAGTRTSPSRPARAARRRLPRSR